MKKFLIDTNILIYLVNGEINASKVFFDETTYFVSIITYMEVMGFEFKDKVEEDAFDKLFKKLNIVYIDIEIANQVIKIRKNKKIKLPDAIIASTAIVSDSELITRNESDFKNIENIKIRNPFK